MLNPLGLSGEPRLFFTVNLEPEEVYLKLSNGDRALTVLKLTNVLFSFVMSYL